MCHDLESCAIQVDDVPQQAGGYLGALSVVLPQVKQQVVEANFHALEFVLEDQLDFASPVILFCADLRWFLPLRPWRRWYGFP